MPRTPSFFIDALLSVVLAATLLLHYTGVLAFFIDADILVIVAILGSLPVIWSAVLSAREGEWSSMDMLASIALVFSLINAEWASAVFIGLMLCGARLLEEITEFRTEASIDSLLKLRPETAKVQRNGSVQSVALAEVRVGDLVIVDTGERVAADGVVSRGSGAVDESTLTGESVPVDKVVASPVYSGTLLQSGSLTISVTKVGKDTTLEKIIDLVKLAREERSTIATMGERFGKIYLVVMLIAAVLLILVTHNMALVLAVVLVVCADDVAIAVPLAYLNAIRVAARHGVIIKGGRHLEALGRAKIFCFDKTGTLTLGKPKVTDVITFGQSEDAVVRIAAMVSGRSEHPLAKAVCAYAAQKNIICSEPDDAEVVGGRGTRGTKDGVQSIVGNIHFLTAEGVSLSSDVQRALDALSTSGKTTSLVASAGAVIGIIGLADEIKPGAKKALDELRAGGAQKLIMLTGDNEFVAARVAKEVGLDAFVSGLMPDEKVARIKEFAQTGEVVMVGDGVNDAAALAAATVGIAMGAIGYDSAIESAEIVLMHDDIGAIPQVVSLAQRVRGVAIQDFWIWGATNLVGLALVFGGVIGAPGAAAYNFVSDFFPLANSLRIRSWQR